MKNRNKLLNIQAQMMLLPPCLTLSVEIISFHQFVIGDWTSHIVEALVLRDLRDFECRLRRASSASIRL